MLFHMLHVQHVAFVMRVVWGSDKGVSRLRSRSGVISGSGSRLPTHGSSRDRRSIAKLRVDLAI